MKKILYILLCILPLNLGALELTGITFGPTNVNLSWSSEYPTGELTNLFIVSRASSLSDEFRYIGNDVLSNNYFSTEDGSISRFYKVRKVKTIDFVDTNLVREVGKQLNNNYASNSTFYPKFSPINAVYDIDSLEGITSLALNENSTPILGGTLNFEGLQYCNNIKSLEINTNRAWYVAFPYLPSITNLKCNAVDWSSINLSSTENLCVMDISNSQLFTLLDLSIHTNLRHLTCNGDVRLENIIVTNCQLLTNLELQRNDKITSVNLSKNKELRTLNCSGSAFTNLNLLSNTNLKSVICKNNPIVDLKLPSGTNLAYLDCSWITGTNLNISSNPGLTYLNCSGTSFSNNNFSANLALTNLIYADLVDGPTTINLYYNTNLTNGYFNCTGSRSLTNIIIKNTTSTNFIIKKNYTNIQKIP